MHHIWKKFAGAGAAAAAALALSLLAAPVSADTTAEIVIAPPVATATTQPDDTQHSGWETVDGKRYYYDPETGEMQTGWLVLTNGSSSVFFTLEVVSSPSPALSLLTTLPSIFTSGVSPMLLRKSALNPVNTNMKKDQV